MPELHEPSAIVVDKTIFQNSGISFLSTFSLYNISRAKRGLILFTASVNMFGENLIEIA